MAWYDRERRRSETASPARFADVGAKERRLPSWLAKGPIEERAPSNRPPPLVRNPASVPPRRSLSNRPSDGPVQNNLARRDSERHRSPSEISTSTRPPSVRPNSHRPSHPSALRQSMSPSELEALILDRASQRAHTEFLESGRLALSDAIESLDQTRRDLMYGIEPRLIELAVLIARRVIARELRTQPELVADLVREGIDSLASRDKVRVKLGTGFALMAVMVEEQLSARGIEAELSVSPALSEHGCVVETDIGRVDESIDSRIASVLEAIDAEEVG